MKKLWITRDGDAIPFEDLRLSHLCNILAMLERNAQSASEKAGVEVSVTDIYPDYDDLKKEFEKKCKIAKERSDIKEAEEKAERAVGDRTDIALRFGLMELD